MLHSYEATKLVDDLIEREQYALADQVAELYADAFDSGELRFQRLLLPLRMGRPEETLRRLVELSNTGKWFSRWFLERKQAFHTLAEDPRWQAALSSLDELERAYWRSKRDAADDPDTGSRPPALLADHRRTRQRI